MRLLLLLAILLLTGCFQYHESYVINMDKGGTASIKLGIPAYIAEMSGGNDLLIDTTLDSISGMVDGGEITWAKSYKENEIHFLEFGVDVPSFNSFNTGDKNFSEGTTQLVENEDGSCTFTRTIQQNQALGTDSVTQDSTSSLETAAMISMMSLMMGNYNWTYTVSCPGIVSEVSENGLINNSASSVTWIVPMVSLMNEKEYSFSVTYFPGEKPLPDPDSSDISVTIEEIMPARPPVTYADVMGMWTTVQIIQKENRTTLKRLKKMQKAWEKYYFSATGADFENVDINEYLQTICQTQYDLLNLYNQ